jgi:DNA-binding GntR family transcriptional regulator
MTAAAEDDLVRALHVDRSSPVPLYFQLAQQLEEAINDGRLTPGTRIDTEVELARQLRLSRPTVRQAMDYLVDKGVIARRRGAGTRVVSADVRRPLELSSLHDDLLRSGQRPTTEVLSMTVEPVSGEVARALQIADDAPAVSLVRLRSAMHRPIARLTNYLPIGFADLTSDELQRRGLYEILRARGIRLHSANQVIGARTATAAEAKLLDERRNAALLTMQRTTLDDHGAVVEFGTHIYAASRYRFEFSLLSP